MVNEDERSFPPLHAAADNHTLNSPAARAKLVGTNNLWAERWRAAHWGRLLVRYHLKSKKPKLVRNVIRLLIGKYVQVRERLVYPVYNKTK